MMRLVTVVEKTPFHQLRKQGVDASTTPFPKLLHLTFDLYLIILRDKQGGIKYHFWNGWYDSTCS